MEERRLSDMHGSKAKEKAKHAALDEGGGLMRRPPPLWAELHSTEGAEAFADTPATLNAVQLVCLCLFQHCGSAPAC